MKRNNLKWILAAVLVITALAAGYFALAHQKAEKEPSLDVVLKEKLTAYETDLRDSLGSIKTNDDAADYLMTWAKNKQIAAERDAEGNVIYTIDAREQVAETKAAAIICSFDASDMDKHIPEIAAALTAAKNAENNGKFHVVFLAENGGDKTGAMALPSGLLDEDTEIICIGTAASARVSQITGGYRHIRISRELTKAEPTYNKAYRIRIQHGPSQSIFGEYDASFNPVKTLGSVLANMKSSSLLFELSAFSGGSDVNQTPSGASMTVVINDHDAEKFEKKLNGFIEKTYDRYIEDYPQLEFTYEEVDMPSSVIAEEDTDNLVSLMYTSFNGVYNRSDDGTITALTNIGRLSTKDSRLKIDIAVMCSDPVLFDEITETYQTICGLCDVNFKVREEYPIYDGSSSSGTAEILKAFKEAYKRFTEGEKINEESTAVLTNCTFIHETAPDLPMIYCGITEESKHAITGALVTWLNRTPDQEK